MNKRVISERMIEEYSDWLWQNEKSPATIRRYRQYLELFRRFAQNRMIDKTLVIRWKEALRQQLAPTTVNGALAALNGLFRHLKWEDCVAKLLKIKKRVYLPEDRELTREEYARMVQAAGAEGNERMAALLQTICITGIRVSELRFVTVEALEIRTVDVECKGKIRTVFLTKDLCRMLKQYAEDKGIASGMIFVTRTGKAMDRSNIWREMKRIGRLAGVDGRKVFPHNLRHLFARIFYSQQKDLLRLSDILGHSNINTTRIYTMESGMNHMRQLEQMQLLIEPKEGEYNRISLLL